MEYYMYFINIDDELVKFGITNDLKRRLREHHYHFINKCKLKDSLDIINVIAFDSEIIYKKAKSRIKDCFVVQKELIKKYDNTEMFLLSKYNFYIDHLMSIINNIVVDCCIVDKLNVRDLTKDEINRIRGLNKISNKSSTDNPERRVCLRCGHNYARLDRHVKTLKECKPIYLNVNRDIMMHDYNILYREYLNLKNLTELGTKLLI